MARSMLASLTAEEIAFAAAATRARLAPSALTFYDISLLESFTSAQKEHLLRTRDESALPRRRARVVVSEREFQRVTVLDVPVSRFDSRPPVCTPRPMVQPGLTGEEYALFERLVKEYEPFRVACRERGVEPDDVKIDCWCVGWFGPEDDPKRRLAWPVIYLQRGDSSHDSLYTQPLEGFQMRVDLWAKPSPRVESFVVDEGAPPPPLPQPNLRFPDLHAELERPPLAPLLVSQPSGCSFELREDGELSWQRWRLLVSFNAREGAVLSRVTYDGRPVAWRLSFVEMVVPYADPHHPHYLKSAFDAGEEGLGSNANSLDPARCDCVPGARPAFLDAALFNEDGTPDVIKNAVCVHEEDGGLLWKHVDWRTGESVARRGRHLVVMFLTTIANYTYGFTYRLGIDASIQMEATLTGILSIGALSAQHPSRPFGQTLTAPLQTSADQTNASAARTAQSGAAKSVLYAADHQHFFVARLDMAVDGVANRVVECEHEPWNPSWDDEEGGYAVTHERRNAFRRRSTVLASERSAARDAKPSTARGWVVESTTATNAVGEPTAWKLEPGGGSAIRVLADADAKYLSRASFLHHNLWVTSYRAEERYPGGDFPNQRPPAMADGLAQWTCRDAHLDGTDVVLWHVFGVTHRVRLEDGPVMPSERVSFMIKPEGFFDASPCVDVPCAACARVVAADRAGTHSEPLRSKL